ncbi:MAG: hypothetical protein NTV06_06075, partial [candidate division Zixibacteria bacterium]|nr:hypothetical protein [candidate division Zixibacteria bacterium]
MNKVKGSFCILSQALPFVAFMLIWLLTPGTINAGQIVITSLPDTIFQTDHIGAAGTIDTIELAGTKLSSGSTGLVLMGTWMNPLNGWYIKLGTDTLEFATDSLGLDTTIYGIRSKGSDGIRIIGHVGSAPPLYSQNITIEGGTIICKAYNRADSVASFNNTCLNIGAEDVYVHNTNMIADGWNGKCVVASGYNVDIEGGTYASNVTHYTSRCQFDATIVSCAKNFDATVAAAQGYTYNFKIHGLTMANTPHAGIRVGSSGGSTNYGVFKIYNNNIMVDARNLTYTVNSGTCASSSNPYALALSSPGPGTEVYNNTITSGTAYGGGRGMLIEDARGTYNNYVKVHDNVINIHEGPNAEYDENHMETHALRIRTGSHRYLWVYNNTITATGDADVGTSSYGKSVTPIRYSWSDEDDIGYTFNIIENNTFVAHSLGAGVTAYGVCYDMVDVLDTTLAFRYNNITSDNIVVKYGEINAGALGIRMLGDTFNIPTPSYSPATFYVGHLGNNWLSYENLIIDGHFEGAAKDTNIIFAGNGTLELGLERLLKIYVKGNNSLPVGGASVWVINNYGDTVVNGITSATGLIDRPVTYWWESRTADDSTGYNNFIIKARKGSDSAAITHTLSATSLSPTLTLNNTAGIEVIDSIP